MALRRRSEDHNGEPVLARTRYVGARRAAARDLATAHAYEIGEGYHVIAPSYGILCVCTVQGSSLLVGADTRVACIRTSHHVGLYSHTARARARARLVSCEPYVVRGAVLYYH